MCPICSGLSTCQDNTRSTILPLIPQTSTQSHLLLTSVVVSWLSHCNTDRKALRPTISPSPVLFLPFLFQTINKDTKETLKHANKNCYTYELLVQEMMRISAEMLDCSMLRFSCEFQIVFSQFQSQCLKDICCKTPNIVSSLICSTSTFKLFTRHLKC